MFAIVESVLIRGPLTSVGGSDYTGRPLTRWRGGTTLAMVRLLYSDVVMGARRPSRNPSVTRPCFEGADKAVESLLFLQLHVEEFQPKFLPLRPSNHCQGHFHRQIIIGQTET